MRRRGVCLLPMLLAAGCDSCNEERPYTPFGVASSNTAVSPPSTSARTPAGPPDAGAFQPTPLHRAPAGAVRWKLGGLDLEAPEGRRFSLALVADFDEDAQQDVVAWTVPRGDAGAADARGELWLFESGDEEVVTRKLASTPGFIPSGPDCELETRLEHTGPRSVTLDVSADCDSSMIPRAPTRGLTVLAPASREPQIVALRIAPPAPGETLNLDVESLDRDGDDRDDVRLTVELWTAKPDRSVAADLVWIDRAAGPSRDTTEPARSLTDVGSVEVVRAKGKNTSLSVPARIGNARRLYASLCSESGTARIFDADGEAFACGDLQRAFTWFATAELRAALTRKDWVGAFGVLTRDGWYHDELPSEDRKKLEKQLLEAARARKIEAPRVVRVTPRARGSTPRWSPLAFESKDTLLVLTARSVARVDLDTLEVDDASEEVDPWPVIPTGGDKSRWSGIGLPCNRSEVVLLTTNADGSPNPPDPIGLIAPRPGACKAPSATAPFDPLPIPVEWSGARRIGLVAGYLFGAEGRLGAAVPRGSPRSPDGKLLVVTTPLGLLVSGAGEPELWRGAVLGRPESLQECVVANGAAAIACVRDRRVLLIRAL